jgi:hypothetical protein
MSATDAFLNATNEFASHDKLLKSAAILIKKVGDHLNLNPENIQFSSLNIPPPKGVGKGQVVDANDWKTVAELQEMIAKWHLLKNRVTEAWSHVPPAHQAHLTRPEWIEDPIIDSVRNRR